MPTELPLSDFTIHLFETGEVTVKGELCTFSEDDRRTTLELLEKAYQRSLDEMPSGAPAFHGEAALWSVMALYRIIQFIMIRSLEASGMDTHITPYSSHHTTLTPPEIYSADLALRQLPGLLNLAGMLAPDDPLIIKVKQLAAQWPFSSVGILLTEAVSDAAILENRALSMAYVDRIILRKDRQRLANRNVEALVEAALGNYTEKLWPGYALTRTTHEHGITQA